MGKRSLLIGLTGGIGVGKSFVASMLGRCGAALIDADQLARSVTEANEPATAALAAALGPEVRCESGALNRRHLADLMFRDVTIRRQVESIVHPAIIERFEQEREALEREGEPVIVYEAALLVETGRYRQMDLLVVVVADDDIRIARVAERDGLSAESIRARIAAQQSQEEKRELGDYVIDNSGAVRVTREQVNFLWYDIVPRWLK